jgi:hypothetical protein
LRATEALRILFGFPALLGALLVGVTLLFGRSAGLSVPNQESMPHAKIGRDILATRTWPTTDSYSFTAYGNDCIAFEWLGDLAMAGAVLKSVEAPSFPGDVLVEG